MIIESINLNYTPNAIIQYFSKIAHIPWSMLLCSSNAKHPYSRFDILVANPLITLTTNNGTTTIKEKNIIISVSKKDPFFLLKYYINKLDFKPKTNFDLPFQGGALGLFGYDLGRYFEEIPEYSQSDLMTPDMAIGIYNWALISDHYLKQLTLVALKNIQTQYNWIKKWSIPTYTPFTLTSNWKTNLNYKKYKKCFYSIQNNIQSGNCYQVNLGQRFQASYKGDEWQAFCLLNKLNKAPFSAFLRLSNSAILSLSPERFLTLINGIIETRPIKGTLPRSQNLKNDLQNVKQLALSEKNCAENLMIVDVLRNDIGRVAIPGSVIVPELFIVESFPAVHHLVSSIRGQLPKTLDAIDLLRVCFPGGSITGAPKISAMKIIDKLEPHRRNAWCGCIGYISCCGRMDTNISIRTLIAENQQIYCSSGGGITADSILDKEYQETFQKISKIKPFLSIKCKF